VRSTLLKGCQRSVEEILNLTWMVGEEEVEDHGKTHLNLASNGFWGGINQLMDEEGILIKPG
jgi:hypothetical protein